MTHQDDPGPDLTPETTTAEEYTLVEVNQTLYYGTIAVYVVLLILIWAFSPRDLKTWVFLAEVLHVLLSIAIFRLEERGGIVMLGMPLIEKKKSGPMFVIWGLMEAVRVSTNYIQHQFPGEPEQVFHGADDETIPHGKVRPFRVTSGGPRTANDARGPYSGVLNIQITTKATGTVRYEIEQPFTFWTRIGGHNFRAKVEELRRQLMDTWTGTIATEWEKRPIGLVIDDGATIRRTLRQRIEEATNSLGIRIAETTLNSPDLSRDLSIELAKVGSANAQALQIKSKAEADKVRITEEGEGAANARRLMLEAEGDGIAYQAGKVGVEGREVFAVQAAATIIGPSDKIILGNEGVAQAFATGAVIMDQVKRKPPEEGATS